VTDIEPRFKQPVKRRAKRGTVPVKVKRWVKERDGHRCVAKVEGVCTGKAEHVHHVVRRAQGGDAGMGNLISLCFPCHEYIHAHVEWARSHGYIRSRSTLKGST
jgi:5-methylcytosine-specific restriction endonuclease McrA